MNNRELYKSVLNLLQDYSVKDREYYSQFSEQWKWLFEKALERNKTYLPEDASAIFTVKHSFSGIDMSFHFDQPKMANWFEEDSKAKKRAAFIPKRLKRSKAGVLSFHDSICAYDPDAGELTLTKKMKNIFACSLPGLPPALSVVYGNKWVDSMFNVFRQNSLPLYLVPPDYVPAFLGSDFEICLYLFMMDYCIIRENYKKVEDQELRQFLHIFRPSPMLLVKGLLSPPEA